MGCNRSCYPAGFVGPRLGPTPQEPIVVGVDRDRELPSRQSIYQGEYARFLLEFDPDEFICNENDFTTSDDQVTVTMEEGADNTVRISVEDDMAVGTEVEIRFRGQLFMIVTVVFLDHIQIDPLQFTLEEGGSPVECDTNLFEVIRSTDLNSTILRAEINGSLLTAYSMRTHGTEYVYMFQGPDSNFIVEVYADGENNYFRANRFSTATGDIVVKWISFSVRGSLYYFNG